MSHGVATQEIEACLLSASEDTQGPISNSMSENANTLVRDSSFPHAPVHSTPQSKRSQPMPMDVHIHDASLSAVDTSPITASVTSTTLDSRVQSQPLRTNLASVSGKEVQQPLSHPGVQSLDQSGSGHQACSVAEDDTTSCETAAMIIANLRGYDDAEEARAELGCTSDMDCNVKNLAVFSAMDR